MYPCETYSHSTYVTNQMACALVNNFTRNLLLYNFIFIYKLITIVTRHCVAATSYAALSLLHCITLYYSCPPPLLILRSFSSVPHRLKVTLFSFTSFIHYGNGGY